MLPKFTKNQALLLEIFYANPGKFYYLRELARMLGKEPGVFQRDINRLVNAGVLKERYQANSRFFALDEAHPLYKELKSIFFKTAGIEGRLREALKEIAGISQAFIYGSFAKGEEKQASDVDVFIVGEPDEDVLLDTLSRLEKKFSRDINYTLMSEDEFQRKIKAGNSFVQNVLKGKRIQLR